MKTVHSQVLSSGPISLSDATSFLSAYNASVCGGGGQAFVGASPATCLFVRRALTSFQELEELHHKLHDRKPTTSEAHDDEEKTTVGDNPSQSFAASRDVTSKPRSSHLDDDVISRRVEVVEQCVGGQIGEIDMVNKEKKRKKKKKRDNVDENRGEIKEEEFGEVKMGSEEKKKMKKRRSKSEVLESGEVDASEKKKKKSEVLESGRVKVDDLEEQQQKRKKKSKNEVLEKGKVDALEEQQEKRKKKRKSQVLESSKVDASEEKRKKRRKS